MSHRLASRLALTLVAASLSACGDSSSSAPSPVNYPSVAGSYNATWTSSSVLALVEAHSASSHSRGAAKPEHPRMQTG